MKYEAVIGLEIHARISSKTKMFCRCSNGVFNAEPNTHICPVCAGFPGALPVPNRSAIQKGIKAALALGCEIRESSRFDRKSYFYPDLPKGFQISQYDKPISENGQVKITRADGRVKEVRIERPHLEDDAGKLTHTAGGTLVDFNRSGTPLMEIVSAPEMNSAEEASLYARQVQKIIRYAGTSDADMEKGQMRFDINVSVRPEGQKKLGVKSEVKNLNSFRSLERALEYEIKRQTELLKNNGQVVQETRGWDDEKGLTTAQRTKEGASGYRYFPEPDIPPLVLTKEMIESLRKEIPELPEAKAARYRKEMGLPRTISDQLAADAPLADYFERAVRVSGEAKKTASWILSGLMGILNEKGITVSESRLSPENLGRLIRLIGEGVITGKIAKEIFPSLYNNNADPESYIREKGLKVMGGADELEEVCREIIDRNPEAAAAFRGGKEKALGALIGQVMAATKGSADPERVNEILRKLIPCGKSP